ncbi:MAG: squalene--hopene cyclase [Thermoleophilia bacterium]|nr:squalene--hopene cyclase [Thermoleophilia bacterium]
MTDTVQGRALVAQSHKVPGAEQALSRAVERLLALQHPDGWWKGLLETNVSIDAEDLLLREFLGVRNEEDTRATAAWIRSKQREDGTWSNFHGGPAELSTTVEAYTALRLAGDPPDAEHMGRTREFVVGAGGIERTRVFTRIWLALFGLWPWSRVPVIPPELIFLPPSVPLNAYDFACWARQTVVALTIVSHHRPVKPVGFDLDELRTGAATPVPGIFGAIDRLLHLYERLPLKPFRDRALKRVEQWILERQEADGCWGGIQPPWVYSLIALSLCGRGVDDPALARGLAAFERYTVREDGLRWIEACQSPVWDTCLAMQALADAGLPPGHEALDRAARWLVGEEIDHRGDWAIRRPELAPGGWAFEFDNDWYPDIDDTAEVVLGLRRAEPTPDVEAAVERGVAWTLGMESRTGGWGAFDADNVRGVMRRLPFCDFGEVIDPPSADVTAHVVEMLAGEGLDTARGVDWLLAEQEADGSWFGRWGANYVYGTGHVLPALVKAGVPPGHPAIRRAVAWLERVQNEDGGWGEDLRSYDDRSWAGRGASTASQTAWALWGLHAAGEADGEAARRGIQFLVRTQREDGGWDEPWYTGTGFPGAFYINYHLYRLIFPVSALGRCLSS